MKINKKTCWYDNEVCPEQMILGAKGNYWPVLEQSDHFYVLKDLINSTDDCYTLLDIGCGAAEISRVFPDYFYTGADLEHIINNVARKLHPTKNYISFDINEPNEGCNFVSEYDIVVMNAFIDVLEKPLLGLNNILKNAVKYVILHRQEIDQKPTRVTENPSYGGVTYHSIINGDEFKNVISINNFSIVKKHHLVGNSMSLLLRKN